MLSDLKVVGLEQAVAAPLCTRILGDWGADVVKVERPGGDFSRSWDTYVGGLSSYFVTLNRNKRSLVLDLKQVAAAEAMERLLGTADVFVCNLTGPALDRLGLAPAALLARHPRLIVCAITGYGSTGPFADRKAYDLLVQGESGVESTTGTTEQPSKLGVPVADFSAGMNAAISILAALHARSLDGRGRVVEVSLFGSLVDWMAQPLAVWMNAGVQFERQGLGHHLHVPYSPFRTRDGVLLNVAVQQDAEWIALCRVLEIEPDRFASFLARRNNRSAVEGVVGEAIGWFDAADLEAALQSAGVASGRLRSVPEVAKHPQAEAIELFQQGAYGNLVGPVLTGGALRLGPPACGEHSRAILSELGYEPAEIDEFLASGASAAP